MRKRAPPGHCTLGAPLDYVDAVTDLVPCKSIRDDDTGEVAGTVDAETVVSGTVVTDGSSTSSPGDIGSSTARPESAAAPPTVRRAAAATAPDLAKLVEPVSPAD